MRRFWDKVKKTSGCWNWTASFAGGGYGTFWFENRLQPAHRVSYILSNGAIPDGNGYHGTCVLHKCDNRLCVNPDHLFLGSNKDNVHDMIAKGRAPYGENHGMAKLTDDQVEVIRRNLGYITQTRLAEIFGVDSSTISNIKRGKYWAHKETTSV